MNIHGWQQPGYRHLDRRATSTELRSQVEARPVAGPYERLKVHARRQRYSDGRAGVQRPRPTFCFSGHGDRQVEWPVQFLLEKHGLLHARFRQPRLYSRRQ
jgi:hypothetical protein